MDFERLFNVSASRESTPRMTSEQAVGTLSGASFCGSAGSSINVLEQTGETIERRLETDKVGSLDSFEFAATTTNGFYGLTKHDADGTDYYYSWTRSNYENAEPPFS